MKVIDMFTKQLIRRFEVDPKEEYRNFLEIKMLRGDVWALLTRLNNENQRAALDNLVDRVMQENDGSKDFEFIAWRDRK